MTPTSPSAPTPQTGEIAPFGQRLAEAIARHGPLCVGIDPHLDRIPNLFGTDPVSRIAAFSEAVIANLAGKIAAIKPQIALFERFGPEGLAVLADLTHAAEAAGLLVLLDAKRGDIGSTAAGYAQAYLGENAWLHADAVTINPLMGADTVHPWVECATQHNKGVIALIRTSNPGAGDIQDKIADAAPIWAHIAQMLAPFATAMTQTGQTWSSLMGVVGATTPEQARQVRQLLPNVIFLVPGYGAQGASATDALAGATPGTKGTQGVIINASRSVLFGDDAPRTLEAWQRGFDTRLRACQKDIATALYHHTPAE